jgi:hypothetical protein
MIFTAASISLIVFGFSFHIARFDVFARLSLPASIILLRRFSFSLIFFSFRLQLCFQADDAIAIRQH